IDTISIDNPYAFKTISTTREQGRMMSTYTQQVLKPRAIDFVYSDDAYGRSINEGFLAGLQGTPRNALKFENTPDRRQASLQQLAQTLAGQMEPGVVCMGLNDTDAQDFLVAVKRGGSKAV